MMSLRTVGLPILLSAAFGLVATPAAAQWERYAGFDAEVRQRSTLVAVAVRIPMGSSSDPEGLEGAAWILGHTLAGQAGAALAALPAEIEVTVDRNSTHFVMTVEPGSWREALRLLERAVFDEPIDAERLGANRSDLDGQLLFTADSPAEDFRRRAAAMLAPSDPRWIHQPYGTRQSVAAVQLADVDLLRTRHFHPARSVGAMVGALDAPELPAAFAPTTAAPSVTGPAWATETDQTVTQEVTNTFLSVAVPFAAEVPRTLQEFVRTMIEDELVAGGRDPYRYGLEVRLVEAPAGPAIVVDASVAPEAAAEMEERITALLDGRRGLRLESGFFAWGRRRFRSERLLADADPRAAALRITDDVAREGASRNLREEIWVLSPEALSRTLDGLGPARVFRLGPDLGGGG